MLAHNDPYCNGPVIVRHSPANNATLTCARTGASTLQL